MSDFEKWFVDFNKQPWPTDPKEFARLVWDGASSETEALKHDIKRSQDRNTTLLADIKKLRGAQNYSSHNFDCAYHKGEACSCGSYDYFQQFDAIIAKYEESHG